MTPTQRKAMEQALEALESKYIVNCGAWRYQQDQAITALRAVLAEQPAEQKKLAIMQRIVDSNTGFIRNPTTPQPAKPAEQEPVAWRELCRRLYVELFHCDQQMTSGRRPKWQQGKSVRDVLADAKAALETEAPQPAKRVPLTDEEIEDFYFDNFSMGQLKAFARAVIAAYDAKNGITGETK